MSEFRVNDVSEGSQGSAAIAVLRDGGFVVVWQSSGGALDDGTDIYARQYDANSHPLAGQFRVNDLNQNQPWNEMYPAVAALKDGGFVVAWQNTNSTGNDGIDIHARRYDASAGDAVAQEFTVNDLMLGLLLLEFR